MSFLSAKSNEDAETHGGSTAQNTDYTNDTKPQTHAGTALPCIHSVVQQ